MLASTSTSMLGMQPCTGGSAESSVARAPRALLSSVHVRSRLLLLAAPPLAPGGFGSGTSSGSAQGNIRRTSPTSTWPRTTYASKGWLSSKL
jgi:hypothetical protein